MGSPSQSRHNIQTSPSLRSSESSSPRSTPPFAFPRQPAQPPYPGSRSVCGEGSQPAGVLTRDRDLRCLNIRRRLPSLFSLSLLLLLPLLLFVSTLALAFQGGTQSPAAYFPSCRPVQYSRHRKETVDKLLPSLGS